MNVNNDLLLKQTIDEAYKIFAGYPAKRPLEVCTYCCMKPEDEGLLASLPVREIPIALLMEYNDSAKPEKTSVEEVKHFLPRYLELVSNFEYTSHSTELSFSRLRPFNREEWTAEELQTLEKFAHYFFLKCLNKYPLALIDQIDSVLIMLWSGGFDLPGLLRLWDQSNSVASVLHFRDIYFGGLVKPSSTKIHDSFVETDFSVIMQEWMDSPQVRKIFEQRIEGFILGPPTPELDEEALNELSLLYDILRSKDRSAG